MSEKLSQLPLATSVADTDFVIATKLISSTLTTVQLTVANLFVGRGGGGGAQIQTFSQATLIQLQTGTAEIIITSCNLTLTGTVNIAFIAFDILNSQYDPGNPKAAIFRIRRTNISGAILASQSFTGSVDSTAGTANEWIGGFTDYVPTDGHYVLTVQETSGSSITQIWSASRYFKLIGL